MVQGGMRFFLDTEFCERGHQYPLSLISVGVVSEDGREYYAVAADGWHPDDCNDWVRAHVLPQLGGVRSSRSAIAQDLVAFCGEKPEFWGYYADYDWVVLCQLFGAMVDLPKGWPMFCRDVKQLQVEIAPGCKLPRQPSGEHNALADARHVRTMYEFLRREDR
jgi:3'-5' exoribonuclease-like protein